MKLLVLSPSVSDILKHTSAHRVKLYIYQDDKVVVLQIADDGRGFKASKGSSRQGLGLASLGKRIREINGTMEISSSDKGTELVFNVPLL